MLCVHNWKMYEFVLLQCDNNEQGGALGAGKLEVW